MDNTETLSYDICVVYIWNMDNNGTLSYGVCTFFIWIILGHCPMVYVYMDLCYKYIVHMDNTGTVYMVYVY